MTKKTAKRLVGLLICIAMLCPATAAAYAEQGKVLRATCLEEYIDATEALKGARIRTGASGMIAESVFSTGRLKVKKELSSLEGAEEGVSYNGETLLRYGSADEAREAYERLSAEYGEENVIVDLPLFTAESQGWGTEYMNLDDEIRREVSIHGENAPKVTVAVIDSGINSSHEIFSGKTISPYSKSLLSETDTIADENGHGTEVAGIIAESTNDNVELMILKTYVDGEAISTETVCQAIRYAADNGADVINLSMATYFKKPGETVPQQYENILEGMEESLRYAADKGVIICASSGNGLIVNGINIGVNMDDYLAYPAMSSNTIAVGAIDKDGNRAVFSNYGSGLDFCAPGQEIIIASHRQDTGYALPDSGTSLAAPYVSACCAFVKMNDPDAGNEEAKAYLKSISADYGDAGWDEYYGWGMPKYEEFIKTVTPVKPAESKVRKVTSVTVNSSTVSAKTVKSAIKKAGAKTKDVKQIILGSKVKKISKKAFKGTYAKTLVVRTKKLKKKTVKNSLKGSKITTVKVKVGGTKANKKFVKKYRSYFTKKNAGRKVRVKR